MHCDAQSKMLPHFLSLSSSASSQAEPKSFQSWHFNGTYSATYLIHDMYLYRMKVIAIEKFYYRWPIARSRTYLDKVITHKGETEKIHWMAANIHNGCLRRMAVFEERNGQREKCQ